MVLASEVEVSVPDVDASVVVSDDDPVLPQPASAATIAVVMTIANIFFFIPITSCDYCY